MKFRNPRKSNFRSNLSEHQILNTKKSLIVAILNSIDFSSINPIRKRAISSQVTSHVIWLIRSKYVEFKPNKLDETISQVIPKIYPIVGRHGLDIINYIPKPPIKVKPKNDPNKIIKVPMNPIVKPDRSKEE